MTASRFLAAVSFCATISTGAVAQQQQVLPPPAVPDSSVPKHNCVKPGDFPGTLSSDIARKAWQRDYNTYSDCLKKFINDQRALAEPYVKASNAAIDEYNSSAKLYNEQIEKVRDAPK